MNYRKAKSNIHQHEAAERRHAEALSIKAKAVNELRNLESNPEHHRFHAKRLESEAARLDFDVAKLESERDAKRGEAATLLAKAVAPNKELDEAKRALVPIESDIRRAKADVMRLEKTLTEAKRVVSEIDAFENALRDQVMKNVDAMLDGQVLVNGKELTQVKLLGGLSREAFIEAQVKAKRIEAQVAAGKRNATKPQKTFNADFMGNKTVQQVEAAREATKFSANAVKDS